MKALVTGARGFIGQYVVKNLMTRKEITSIVRTTGNSNIVESDKNYRFLPIEDYERVETLIEDVKPDIIYHLAANPNTKEGDNPVEISHTNYIGTHNLLAAIKKTKMSPKFVFASSATVYGNTRGLSSENAPLNPTSTYGVTKLASENLIEVYYKEGIIRPLICRLVANVGKGATHGVVPDVIRKVKSDSKELELFGEKPGSIKPYMYVVDTANCIVELSFNTGLNHIYNVCGDDSISISELANQVMKSTNIYKPIKWLGKSSLWFGDNPQVLVSNERLKNKQIYTNFNTSLGAIKQATLEMINE